MPNLVEGPSTVVVVAGGEQPDPTTARLIPVGARVLAADSGADHAVRLGLLVDELIGDLDSVSPEALAAVTAQGATINRYPEAKDFTDLELTLQVAAAARPARIVVIGGHGGRPDHQLAGLLLLASPWLAASTVSAWNGQALVSVVRPGPALGLRGAAGSIVTLIPFAQVEGITTSGLVYPLRDEPLVLGSTRGVSNELLDNEASVVCRTGVLIVIQPDALAHHLLLAEDTSPTPRQRTPDPHEPEEDRP